MNYSDKKKKNIRKLKKEIKSILLLTWTQWLVYIFIIRHMV